MQRIVYFIYASVAIFMALGGLFALGLLALDFWMPGLFIPGHETLQHGLWIDGGLILLFGLQHSWMARAKFKQQMGRFIPPVLVKSNYILLSGFCLLVIAGFWVRVPTVVYDLRETWAYWLFLFISIAGLGLVGWAGKVLNGAELLGVDVLRTVFTGKEAPESEFMTPGPYRFVRHPIYTGILLLLWSIPVATLDQLLFSVGFTLYLVIGTKYEEKDLLARFGEKYHDYQRKVPMFIPFLGKRG